MYKNILILNFLSKYFFILQAASDGWRVSYVGGNKFEFYNLKSNVLNTNTNDFLNKYKVNIK